MVQMFHSFYRCAVAHLISLRINARALRCGLVNCIRECNMQSSVYSFRMLITILGSILFLFSTLLIIVSLWIKNYISPRQRVGRSIATGFAMSVWVLGVFTTISGLFSSASENISISSWLSSMLILFICLLLPMGVIFGLSIYSKLWLKTKNEDDILFHHTKSENVYSLP